MASFVCLSIVSWELALLELALGDNGALTF